MIYLAQTDTTAGFLSKDYKELNLAKKRELKKPCIITSAYFFALKNLARVPNNYKNKVRRAKKTTFIYKNKVSFRIIHDCRHKEFLKSFIFLYSSSANLHGNNFNLDYALRMADVIVDDNFCENSSSKIYKLNNKNIKRLR